MEINTDRQYRKGSPVIDYSYDDIDFNEDMDKTAFGEMKVLFHRFANSGIGVRNYDSGVSRS